MLLQMIQYSLINLQKKFPSTQTREFFYVLLVSFGVIAVNAILTIIRDISKLIIIGIVPINPLSTSERMTGNPREQIDSQYSLPKLNLLTLFGISANSDTTSAPRKNPAMLQKIVNIRKTQKRILKVGDRRYISCFEKVIYSSSASSRY